ncbi:MAG: phosphoglucomutase/phosphomannomutase family protein [Elusimicrobiota bacterium]
MKEETKAADEIVFGTDGWRSVIGDGFTFPNVRRVAEALGRVLLPKSHVVVGYDYRFHSENFARAAGAVLAAQKHKVTLLSGATTSPGLSFSVRSLKARAGVMITARHNPPLFNGFKVKAAAGCSADPEFTRQIQETIQADVPPPPENFPSRSYSPDDAYLKFLLSKLDRKLWGKSGLKVVADGMHGPGGKLWERLFAGLKVKGRVLRAARDPLFGGMAPEPVEANLAGLSQAVLADGAALGLAVDGDADRLGAVDEKGRYIPPHHVFPLLLLHLLETRKLSGKVVQAFSLGYVSERIAKKFGLELEIVPIGFKYVVQRMLKEKVLLGGEESGGYGVGMWAPERDGLLSGLLLLEMVLARGKPLSEIRADMEARFGVSVFLRQDFPLKAPPADKEKWAAALENKLPAKIAGEKVRESRRLDGLKVILEDDSWVLLRPSGTEPLLRTYAESPSLEKTKRLLAKAQEIATIRNS